MSLPPRLKYCGFNEYLFSGSRWSLHPYRPRDFLWVLLLADLFSLLLHTLVFLGGTTYYQLMLLPRIYRKRFVSV